MLTSLGRTRPPEACRACDTALREYAVSATEMAMGKWEYCWKKKSLGKPRILQNRFS